MADVDLSPSAVADRLATYNRWRRGDDVEMPVPADLGRDIDAAIELLRRAAETTALRTIETTRPEDTR